MAPTKAKMLRCAGCRVEFTTSPGDCFRPAVKQVKHRKKPNMRRDPKRPKRPLTAFMLYSSAVRSKVANSNSNTNIPLSFGEVGKKVSELYRALSAEERAEWDENALAEKERYHPRSIGSPNLILGRLALSISLLSI